MDSEFCATPTIAAEEPFVDLGRKAKSDWKPVWERLDALERDMANREEDLAELREGRVKLMEGLKDERVKFMEDLNDVTTKLIEGLKDERVKLIGGLKEDTARSRERIAQFEESIVKLKEKNVNAKGHRGKLSKLDERITKLEEDRAEKLRAELYSSLCSGRFPRPIY